MNISDFLKIYKILINWFQTLLSMFILFLVQRYNNYLNQTNKYESIVQLLAHFNSIV